MTTTALLEPPRQRSDSAPVSPSSSATCPNSTVPACDTNPAPSDVTSDFYRYSASITHHLHGETSKRSGFRYSQSQESLLSRTTPRPRTPGGASLTARSGANPRC
jgi:hypothetical protein